MTFNPKEVIPAESQLGEFFSYVIAGPGGTGKSSFLGSMAKYVKDTYGKKTLLIATLPREIRSWKYQELGPDYLDRVIVEDEDWRPDLKRFNATGFQKTLEIEEWLYDNESYGAVILDNGTEHAEQAWHACLAPLSVSSPSEIEGRSRWLPYERLDAMLDQSVKSLVSLTTHPTAPKFVGISWHIQAPKDDTVEGDGTGGKTVKQSADNQAKGIEYEGEILPMIRGKYRRRLVNQVEAMLHTEIQQRQMLKDGKLVQDVSYMIQVRPNAERHVKLPGAMPGFTFIPNDFESFVQVLKNEYKSVEKPASADVNLNFRSKK